MKPGYGKCRWCRRDVQQRTNGTLRKHLPTPPGAYRRPGRGGYDRIDDYCPGSGKTPEPVNQRDAGA